jgi:hypothetical protein
LSRLSLEITQPRVHWVPGIYPGVTSAEVKKTFFCLNPLLFASCTNTFSKWCQITRAMKRSAQ